MFRRAKSTTTTVVHDTFLLAAPRLDAPIIVLIRAGTNITYQSIKNGFCAIEYQEWHGFIPAALCSPWAVETRNTYTFRYPLYLRPDTLVDQIESFPVIAPRQAVIHLGTYKSYDFVYRKDDGMQGFVDLRVDEYRDEGCSCLLAFPWFSSRFFWLFINLTVISNILSTFLNEEDFFFKLPLAFISLIVPTIMFYRSHSRFTINFSLGAIMMGLINQISIFIP